MTDGNAANKSADIAIIGMACLFPGAKDVRRYWENICRSVDAVREVPPERWRTEDFYSEDRLARDRLYSRWGAFLDPVVFDPVKWHIPPASLRHIEPMQLLSLEVAWQAMVDAGYDPLRRMDFPRERAGVLFAVPGSHELGTAYCFRTMMRHYLPKVKELSPETREQIYTSLEEQLPEWSEDSFPGFLGNVIAGRIAREFDFHGPNFTVDAACAASLAALFTAVELLRSGASDLMLVGGADGTNNPFGFMSFAKTHALSPRGKSRAFDASGDGIALGEGVAVVVLKRLRDAEREGDKIYAVIKGVGSSSDGKNRSLTAPHPPGQMRAVQRAYEDAGISPASVTLIEAHGTGTVVGDSAELTALTQVFAEHTDDRQYIAVGSVKSMIGHTKTVAGLASLIKTVLALKQRVLPPTLHVEKPSTRVDLENSPLYLNTETRPWTAENNDHSRRAGVSSFGFGGTNFHVVLEEYHGGEELNWTPRGAEVFSFQRASRAEMIRDLQQLHQQLDIVGRPSQAVRGIDGLGSPSYINQQLDGIVTEDFAGLAAAVFADESSRILTSTLCRMAIVAGSLEDLRQKLHKAVTLLTDKKDINDPIGVYYSEAAPLRDSQVCFLYPGQGSQSVNMLRDLATACPWSHDLFHEANRLLQEDLSQPLTRLLYPPPVFDDAARERQTAALRDTRIAQPALGLVELFATDLLERFGVRPAFAAGHSYGEHVALHVAGCLSRTDLLRLSAYRGRVCAEAAAACPGAMVSVQASAAAVETALQELNGTVVLANRNAPDQTVIAGSTAAMDAAVERLSQRGLRTRKLAVSAAFHTPLLTAAAEAMRSHLAGLAFERPRLPVYSNTTGQRHAEEAVSIRGLLTRHFSEPVLFENEVRQLYADGARVFVEVGPGKVLTDLVARILVDEPIAALNLDAPGREGWTQLGHLLARLSVLGLPVRLAAWFAGRGLRTNSLAEFVAQTRAANTPKPSDWILHPNKAEPVTPPSGRTGETPVPPPSVKREKVSSAMTTTNGEANGLSSVPGAVAASSDLFAQFQATTRLLLEAQQAQNRVLERYLETQERLLLHCSQNAASQPAAKITPAQVAAPRPRPPVPIPRTTATTSIKRTGSISDGRESVADASGSYSTANGVHVNGSSPPAHRPSANGDGPPTIEMFRRDLLDVVSARTGYPIDALDENLALEAELGIDSIKTVEIFSNLKAYHAYFRAEEQEEEELLAEFTKLRTLRDIIDSYDRRLHALLATPSRSRVSAKPQAAKEAVQRYVVTSVAAPLESNGEKKTA